MSSRVRAIGWAVLALLFAAAFQQQRPLADPDEGRYAEAAREMLVHRDPLLPRLDERPHLTKPPGAYWATLSGIKVFGVNPAGARAGVALAFAAWILGAAALGGRLGGDGSSALWAGIVLATSLGPFVGGSLLTPDIFIAAFGAWTAVAGARALEQPETRRASVRTMWLLAGMLFVFKGPPALLPLVGVAVAWPRRFAPESRGRFVDGCGLALFAAAGLGWYAWLGASEPQTLATLVRHELFESPFEGSLNRGGPVWMPALVLAVGALPWGLWLLARAEKLGAAQSVSPTARLLFVWGAVGLLLFTLSRSRMPLYVLPLFTTIAAPAGVAVARWARISSLRMAAAVALTAAAAGVLLSARAVAGEHPRFRHSSALAQLVEERRAPGEPVFVLQSRFLPGLAFALRRDLVTVAMNVGEEQGPYDITAAELQACLAANPAGAVAVAPPAAFEALRDEIAIDRLAVDRASRFAAARIGPQGGRNLYSASGPAPRRAVDCPVSWTEARGDDCGAGGALGRDDPRRLVGRRAPAR